LIAYDRVPQTFEEAMSLRRFLSAFPALALAAVLAAQPLAAQEIDDDNQDLSLFARLLGGVGLLAIPGPGIDYKERPGLVVPPTVTHIQPSAQPPQNPHHQQVNAQPDPWNFNSPAAIQPPVAAPGPDQTTSLTLPPPLDPSTVRQRNPDFPVDPEIRASQKAKAMKKKKGPRLIADDPFYGGRVLRGDELKSPTAPNQTRAVVRDKDGPGRTPTRDFEVPVISNLFGGSKKENQPVQFTGEPPRQSLTEPPAGYLTPSANAPYGVVGKDKPEHEAPTVHPNMPNAPTPQTQ
jgi:hypothetical protein